LIAVDTSVLSLAFRRTPRPPSDEHPAVGKLRAALQAGVPVLIPGICMQEVLSGVRTREQFERLARLLSPFPVLLASRVHHLAAARIGNDCRARGLATTTVDALIAAITIEHGARLLTTDRDFQRVARLSELRLEPHTAR